MKITILVVTLVMLASLQAFTDSDSRDQCKREAESLCKKYVKDREQMMGCLKEKVHRMSDQCKGATLRMLKGPENSIECKADMKKYCSNIRPGPRMHSCIRSNIREFSDICRSYLHKLRQQGPPRR